MALAVSPVLPGDAAAFTPAPWVAEERPRPIASGIGSLPTIVTAAEAGEAISAQIGQCGRAERDAAAAAEMTQGSGVDPRTLTMIQVRKCQPARRDNPTQSIAKGTVL